MVSPTYLSAELREESFQDCLKRLFLSNKPSFFPEGAACLLPLTAEGLVTSYF
jgi:hypothetical protein